MSDYRREDYYNKTELKESFGFTEKMIRDLLPEPMERQNPNYRNGSPMKLWPKADIERIIESEAYARAKEAADKRRAVAAKGTATKRAKTAREVDEAIARISVERPRYLRSDASVLKAGIEHKEALDEARGKWGDGYHDVDTATAERWAVNFIRHELTDYEYELYETHGKVGRLEEYKRYRAAVLDAIAQEYPFLADECEQQKQAKDRRY